MECFIGERSPWLEYRILFLWRMRLKDTKFAKQVEADQYSIIATDATQMLSSTIKWQFLEGRVFRTPINVILFASSSFFDPIKG
jgi:hypothetical protein